MKSVFGSMVDHLSEVQVDVDVSPAKPSRAPPELSSISNEYPEAAIRAATRDFAKDNILGSGACGSVYKGVMADGTEVAVKVLELHDFSGFEDEVRVLSRFRHPNLVILMGYARHSDTGHRSLVYEYLSGGDLSGQLRHSRKGTRPFPAAKRLAVALDAASGLSHLHNARPRAFHRDIKSANILLDRNGTAKMADFGLARVSPSAQHRVTAASGTPGYACPEYLRTGIVTEGSEAHSFGMVLLELLTGTPPAVVQPDGPDKLHFPFEHLDGSADKVLKMLDASAKWPESLARTVAELAFLCIDPKPEMRPRFSQIVEILRWMQDPASEVSPESLKRMVDLVAPSWSSIAEAQAKSEAKAAEVERQQEIGRLTCLRAEGVDLEALGEEALGVALPTCGEEIIVGRSGQPASFWSAATLDERLRGMVSREHFKVFARLEPPEEGVGPAVAAVYAACLSFNGIMVNNETIRRDGAPRRLRHGDVISFIDVSDPGGESRPFLAFRVTLHEHVRSFLGQEPARPAPPVDALASLEVFGQQADMQLPAEARRLFLQAEESSVSTVHLRIGREHQREFWSAALKPEYYLGGSWAFLASEHFEVVAQPAGAGRPLGAADSSAGCGWRFRVRVLALAGVVINHSMVYTCGDEQELKSGDVLTVEAPGLRPEAAVGAPAEMARERGGLHFTFAVAATGSRARPASAGPQPPLTMDVPSREQPRTPRTELSRPQPSRTVSRSGGDAVQEDPSQVVEWKTKIGIPTIRPSAPSVPVDTAGPVAGTAVVAHPVAEPALDAVAVAAAVAGQAPMQEPPRSEPASSGLSLASSSIPESLKSRAAGVLMMPVHVETEYQ